MIFKVNLLEKNQLIDIRRKLHKSLINLQMGLVYVQDKIKLFNKIGLCYPYLALVEVKDEKNVFKMHIIISICLILYV